MIHLNTRRDYFLLKDMSHLWLRGINVFIWQEWSRIHCTELILLLKGLAKNSGAV